MNEYERQRLMQVVRDWRDRAHRSLADRLAFYIGVMAAVDTMDGMCSEQARSIAFDVNAILEEGMH